MGNYFTSILYVYRMSMGDFNTASFDSEDMIGGWYAWILFILCTVLNMIIMLNLLVAIIGESFAKINAQSVEASYKEKADIISENTYIIPQHKKDSLCEENKYLLIVTD
jgi:uncharacterized membrane protein